VILPNTGAKELKRHSFKMLATFFHHSPIFLFRQQGPLSDPKGSPENYLQVGVSNYSLEHCIVSIQPQTQHMAAIPTIIWPLKLGAKLLNQDPNIWEVLFGGGGQPENGDLRIFIDFGGCNL